MLEFILILLGMIVRWVVSMGGYSGAATPPMFGDYEAQRHWMELTQALHPDEWYTYDLGYWGVDYPPLTCYHMKLVGHVGSLINPEWFAFVASRGHESVEAKIFMRSSVILSEIVFYLAALMIRRRLGLFAFCALIFNPALILVDHGHFQYNNVSLGLAIIGMCLVTDQKLSKRVLGCVAFTLALLYKQMELYHSFAFFFVLIGWSLKRPTWLGTIGECIVYGGAVISTATLTLLPFLSSWRQNLPQIMHRLFPLARGLFEDKVANVWCTLHTVLKLRKHFDESQQLQLATLATLIFAIAPCLKLLKSQKLSTMITCSSASALGFFLFSFQVHEKQALLFIVPACALLGESTLFTLVYAHTAFFSMMPLFAKDGLLDHYFAMRIMSIGVFILLKDQIKNDINRMQTLCPGLVTGGRFGGFAVPLGAILFAQEVMWYLTRFQKAPKKLPDLWAVLVSSMACFLFCLFYAAHLVSLYTELLEPPKAARRPNPYQRRVEAKSETTKKME